MKKVKAISIIGFIALIVAIMVMPAAAGFEPGECDIYVYEGESIQAAINSASDGDTICVYNGTYSPASPLETKKTYLKIIGEGADAVTLNCGGDKEGIIIPSHSSTDDGTGTVIDGFTFVNGLVGIWVGYTEPDMAKDCIIRNCVFDGITGDFAVWIAGTNATFENNVISNPSGCFGLYLEKESPTVTNNTVINARGEPGAAIFLNTGNCANSIIAKNNITLSKAGIGIAETGSGNKIYLNDFVDNDVTAMALGAQTATIYWNSTEQIEYTYNGETHECYMGNYWDVHSDGESAECPGILDTPYTVPDGLGEDYRPLMAGFENYLGAPTPPEPNATVYLVPENSSASYCNEVEVEIWTNTSDPDLASGQINLTYDTDCANVTNFARDAAWGMGAWNSNTDGKEWITFVSDTPKTGEVLIGTLTVHCVNESLGNCTTGLVFDEDSKLFTAMEEIDTAWEDGSFACANVPELPDLVIVDKSEEWVSLAEKTYDVTYTVKNAGDAEASASNTTITIDGVDVLEDTVPGLAAGVSYTNTVGPFTMSDASDTIKVCADNGGVVAESDETNNCVENVFEYEAIPEYTIKIGEYTINLNSDGEVTVPVELLNATDVAGGSVNISFDPSIVEVQTVTSGHFGTPLFYIDNTNGFVRVAAAGTTAAGIEEAVLANILFKGTAEGHTDLNIRDALLNFEEGAITTPATIPGSVTVERYMQGDLNHNNVIDTGDATLVLRMVVGLTPADMLGDMNGNGMIDTGDATLILRTVVGL